MERQGLQRTVYSGPVTGRTVTNDESGIITPLLLLT